MTDPMTDPMTDAVMEGIRRAQEMSLAGDKAGARARLERLWDTTDDPLHRSTAAHFLADLQESVQEELRWDELALEAFSHVTEERAREYNASWQTRSFLPSLQLSLADDHRRAGQESQARHHLAEAAATLAALPDDEYGALIRGAFDMVRDAIESGSTAPLAPAG